MTGHECTQEVPNCQENFPLLAEKSDSFSSWLDSNFSRVCSDIIKLAEIEATNLAGASCQLPGNLQFTSEGSKGYFIVESGELKGKLGYIATLANGKPLLTAINHKSGERITVKAWDIYQADNTGKPVAYPHINIYPLSSPKIEQATCKACGDNHNGSGELCYHCYIKQLYPVALPIQSHPYLTQKSIPVDLANATGCRAYNGMLLIPMSSGFQVIKPNGDKRYAIKRGTKAGSSLQIGEIGDKIYICEGFATGISCHMALDTGVVVAFDAHNLDPVVHQLRGQYPLAQIVILADNDIKRGKPNVGVRAAKEVALKHGCHVSIPPTRVKADWNDYHRKHGLRATRRTIKTQTLKVVKPVDMRLREAGLSDEAVNLVINSGIEIRFINQPELSPLGLGDIDGRSVLLKSGMGTGKTKGIAKPLVEAAESAIVVNHLISLARNAATVLGCVLYLDSDIPSQKMVVVVNSLRKFLGDYGLLFIDEIEGVLKAMADGGHIDNKDRPGIFEALNEQVNRARTKIFASADIDALTIRWWLENDQNRNKVIIINEASRLTGKTINLFDKKSACMDRLKADIEAGKRVLVACDSVNLARMFGDSATSRIDSQFDGLFEGKRVVWISSENSSNADIVEFLTNISAGSYTETDILIFTPTIGEGVSIEKSHFDTHYFIGAGAIDVLKAMQMIGRDRTAANINIYLPKTGLGVPKEFSFEQYKAEQIEKIRKEFEQLRDNVEQKLYEHIRDNLRLTPLDEHIAYAKWRYAILNRDYRRNFARLAMAAGYNVVPVDCDGDFSLAMELEAVKLARYEDIARSNDITDTEASRLENSDSLTSDQQYQLEKYRVKSAYGVLSVDSELLVLDDRGKTRQVVTRRAELLTDNRNLARLDIERNEGVALYQAKYSLIRKEFFSKVCEAVGIEVTASGLNFDNAKYLGRIGDYSDFQAYLAANMSALNASGLGLTRLTADRVLKPYLVLNEALRLLGVAKIRTNSPTIGNWYKLADRFEGVNFDIVSQAVSLAVDKMSVKCANFDMVNLTVVEKLHIPDYSGSQTTTMVCRCGELATFDGESVDCGHCGETWGSFDGFMRECYPVKVATG